MVSLNKRKRNSAGNTTQGAGDKSSEYKINANTGADTNTRSQQRKPKPYGNPA